MNRFRVWIRPLGDFCLVRVDGNDNLKWLLGQLSQSFVFPTFEPVKNIDDSSLYTFEVPCNPPLTFNGVKRCLAIIPEVKLMHELA